MRLYGFMSASEQKKMTNLINDKVAKDIGNGVHDRPVYIVGNAALNQAKGLLAAGAIPDRTKEKSDILREMVWAEPRIMPAAVKGIGGRGTFMPGRVGLIVSNHPASVRYEFGLPYDFPAINGRRATVPYPMLAFMRNGARIAASQSGNQFRLTSGGP